MAHPGGAEDPGEVDREDQPDLGLAQREGRRQQPVADVIVDGDEAAHQQERLGEEPGQARIGEMGPIGPEPGAEGERAGMEMARGRQAGGEDDAAADAEPGDRGGREAPAIEIREQAGEQSAGHAAEAAAADIEAHRQADRARVHLLGHIGHRDRRQPAEAQPHQRPHGEQLPPVRQRRRRQLEQRGGEQRGHHHGLAPERLRERAGEQHEDGERGRREREREAALGRAHVEFAREDRQQRLHRVEQREGCKTGGEQSEVDAQEGGASGRDVLGRAGGRGRSGQGARLAGGRHAVQCGRPGAAMRRRCFFTVCCYAI